MRLFKKLVDTEYSKLNVLISKFYYCSKCFRQSICIKHKLTLLSFLKIKDRELVFYCNDCNCLTKPISKEELRDHKIKNIIYK